MKTLKKILVLLIVSTLLFALPISAQAAGYHNDTIPDQFVFGENYTLESGETLKGSLVVFGGNVEIEQDATVTGDVIVMGGNVDCNGLIEKDILVLGGHVTLEETAVVDGDILTLGGSLDQMSGAQIHGNVAEEIPGDLKFDTYGPFEFPIISSGVMQAPAIWGSLWFLWVPFAMLTMAALAMLIAMFLPKHVERVAKAATSQPLISGGMGLLTALLLPFALILMTITCVLIIFIPVVVVVLGLAALLGWIAIGLEVGKRIAKMFDKTWDPSLSACIGAFLLTLIAAGSNVALEMVCLGCISWVIPTAIGLIGLGASLLTLFGTREYPPVVNASLEGPTDLLALDEPKDDIEISEPESSE